MAPTVRVGIVSWCTAPLLDRCLAALPAALEGVGAEIVVVDNDSDDDSAEVARAHRVTVVRNPVNVGYARAMNRALADTSAPTLCALNPDTEAPPGSLAALVGRLHARPDVGLVGPGLAHLDGAPQHSVYRFPSPAISLGASALPLRVQQGRLGRRLGLEAAGPPTEPADIDWMIGAVHVVRRAALVGRRALYDERWFMYTEDMELCWWLAQRRWRRRIEADIVVPHVGNAAGAIAWGGTRAARWLAGNYDWYARDRGTGAARAWAAANLAGTTLAIARRLATRSPADAAALASVLAVHGRALLRPAGDPVALLSPPGPGRGS